MPSSSANTVEHEFVAHHCGVDESEFAITVGFSRDPADESSLDGLLVQRGRGAEDDTPGISGVYVEIPIQRHVVYGGVIEATLRRDSFTLRFDDATAQTMAGFREIVACFDLQDEQFASIRDALRFVFKGCPCYREDFDDA
jgi:hypothetical protein